MFPPWGPFGVFASTAGLPSIWGFHTLKYRGASVGRSRRPSRGGAMFGTVQNSGQHFVQTVQTTKPQAPPRTSD